MALERCFCIKRAAQGLRAMPVTQWRIRNGEAKCKQLCDFTKLLLPATKDFFQQQRPCLIAPCAPVELDNGCTIQAVTCTVVGLIKSLVYCTLL